MTTQTVSFSLEKTVSMLIAEHVEYTTIKYEITDVDVSKTNYRKRLTIWLGHNKQSVFCNFNLNIEPYRFIIDVWPLVKNNVKRKITDYYDEESMSSFGTTQEYEGKQIVYKINYTKSLSDFCEEVFLYYYDGLLGLFDCDDNNWICSTPVSDLDAFKLMKYIITEIDKNN